MKKKIRLVYASLIGLSSANFLVLSSIKNNTNININVLDNTSKTINSNLKSEIFNAYSRFLKNVDELHKQSAAEYRHSFNDSIKKLKDPVSGSKDNYCTFDKNTYKHIINIYDEVNIDEVTLSIDNYTPPDSSKQIRMWAIIGGCSGLAAMLLIGFSIFVIRRRKR